MVTANATPAVSSAMTEEQFALYVQTRANEPQHRASLRELLREDHFVYDERSTPDVVRMRGWLLVCLAKNGLADDELVYVLEELQTGLDTYLVAAAACALRTCSSPRAEFAPFVMRAIVNVRYQDQRISLDEYGGFASEGTSTSAVRELLSVLKWLGPRALSVVDQVQALLQEQGGLPRRLHPEIQLAIQAIRKPETTGSDVDDCCHLPFLTPSIFSWAIRNRSGHHPVEEIDFQDHQGTELRFADVFRDRPSIVVFFYTRCDNPLKCSLTITKLAQVQQQLRERGLADQVQTVAITYDPQYDMPRRLEVYALNRGLQLDAHHFILRTTSGFDTLRKHFRLGVNFVDAFVNRHRIELFVVDQRGRIASSFERLHWSVDQVVDQAASIRHEGDAVGDDADTVDSDHPSSTTASAGSVRAASGSGTSGRPASLVVAAMTSLGIAFFPKCPLCWAAYLSLFGIAGLEKIPYTPALQPILALLMLFNLTCLWSRARRTRRLPGFLLAVSGAVVLLVSRSGLGWQSASPWGLALTLVGALWCSLPAMSKDGIAQPFVATK